MNSKQVWSLIRETFKQWIKDKAPKLAAALSFYTVFATAPLLIFMIAIAGIFLNQQAAQGEIVAQLQGLIGPEGSKIIEQMIVGASKPGSGTLATIIGFVTLVIGATGAFVELKDSLNTIWEVPRNARRGGLKAVVAERFLSFAMIMGIGFLLLVSLVVSAGLAAVSRYFNGYFPEIGAVWKLVNLLVSLSVITVLFAMMFKFLPDAKIPWSDVWFGSFVTAILFSAGKALIGFYIGHGAVGNVYGAAGSLAVLFLWVYYSAQIFFLGAEFTQVYSLRHGSRKDSPRS